MGNLARKVGDSLTNDIIEWLEFPVDKTRWYCDFDGDDEDDDDDDGILFFVTFSATLRLIRG